MSGFVYRWTNKLNGKWYIGSHRGSIDDGYTASGVLIKQSFKKHGIENFEREILYQGDNYVAEEKRLLKESNAAKDSKSYNLINTASDNFDGHRVRGDAHHMKRPEIAKKVSDSKKGKPNGHKGMKHSEETKKKMSVNNAMHRKECQEKLSKVLTGRSLSQEHRDSISKGMKGKAWTQARWDAYYKGKGK